MIICLQYTFPHPAHRPGGPIPPGRCVRVGKSFPHLPPPSPTPHTGQEGTPLTRGVPSRTVCRYRFPHSNKLTSPPSPPSPSMFIAVVTAMAVPKVFSWKDPNFHWHIQMLSMTIQKKSPPPPHPRNTNAVTTAINIEGKG